MSMWRLLASVAAVLAGVGSASAQTYSLAEAPLAKSCYRIELTMDLAGAIRVQQEGKTLELKQSATAKHLFLERVIDAKETVAEKTARIYQTAEATITVDQDVSKRTLRPDHALLIAQRTKDLTLTYCPKGLLTQEEMELTEHLDTLTLPGLLPTKDVAVGDTWDVPLPVALAVCALDGLESQNLKGRLEEVKGDSALGSFKGIVKGIERGAKATIEVDGRFEFDLKEKRLVGLTWKQADQRGQTPVSPDMSASVTYVLKRTPILEPNELNELALVTALAVPAEKMAAISYRDAKGRFEFQHGRDWHLVGQQEKHVVYRLLSSRGDYIAQMTLTPYKKAEAGKMMELDDFADLVLNAPGWENEKELERTAKVDVAGDSGLKVYRVAAAGKLNDVSAVQYCYLVNGVQGNQLLVTFTMDPSQVEKLDSRDVSLIRSIAFPSGDDATAQGKLGIEE